MDIRSDNKSMLLACDDALQYPEMITEALINLIFKYLYLSWHPGKRVWYKNLSSVMK